MNILFEIGKEFVVEFATSMTIGATFRTASYLTDFCKEIRNSKKEKEEEEEE